LRAQTSILLISIKHAILAETKIRYYFKGLEVSLASGMFSGEGNLQIFGIYLCKNLEILDLKKKRREATQ